MIGMTAMPEASLARELGICFAMIAVITNRAAGIAGGKLTAAEVISTMQASAKNISSLLAAYFAQDFKPPACSCRQAIDEAKI
jgi:5'-methylthioadenosine phosphorylase